MNRITFFRNWLSCMPKLTCFLFDPVAECLFVHIYFMAVSISSFEKPYSFLALQVACLVNFITFEGCNQQSLKICTAFLFLKFHINKRRYSYICHRRWPVRIHTNVNSDGYRALSILPVYFINN